jgi:hypothetical protein
MVRKTTQAGPITTSDSNPVARLFVSNVLAGPLLGTLLS